VKPFIQSSKNSFHQYEGLTPNFDMTQSDYSKFIDGHKLNQLISQLPATDSKRLQSCKAPHASAWLHAPPCRYQGIKFTDFQFRTTCLRWLGENVSHNTDCLACTSNLSPKASHATRCRHGPGMISRHNAMRDVIFNLASTACLSPVLEKAGLLGDAPGRRPGDVYLPSWNNASLAIDVAVTCPLQEKFKNCPNPSEEYARTVKHADYDPGFANTNIIFCAAVVDTFGCWSEEGLEVISEIIRRGAKRLTTDPSRYIATAWQQLACTLQRHNSGMILSRTLPPDTNII
jgi:hypothetical protein